MSRKGVDEGDTPTTDSMQEGAQHAAPHVAPPPMRWLASGIRSDDHRLTHDLSCLHCLQSRQFAL